jgi:hypothetical protein
MPTRIRYAYSQPKAVTFLGRNHAGRPRHRLVRAKRTRLGLAGAAARQPDASATVTDERRDVRRRPQDHASPVDGKARVEAQDRREAFDRPSHDESQALDRQTLDDQTLDGETYGAQDRAAQLRRVASLDRKADQQAQHDT